MLTINLTTEVKAPTKVLLDMITKQGLFSTMFHSDKKDMLIYFSNKGTQENVIIPNKGKFLFIRYDKTSNTVRFLELKKRKFFRRIGYAFHMLHTERFINIAIEEPYKMRAFENFDELRNSEFANMETLNEAFRDLPFNSKLNELEVEIILKSSK